MQAAGAQGAVDVRFKRKADDDNQMFDFKNNPMAYDMMRKQYQKNNDTRTKMLAGAEAAVVKAKGVAESKVILADAAVVKAKGLAELKVISAVGIAEVYAIRLVADGKKTVNDAEAEKIKAETALLQFELDQKKKAAGNAHVVPAAMLKKSKPVAQANAPMVPVAIYNKNNRTKSLTLQQKQAFRCNSPVRSGSVEYTKPLTEGQKLNKNNKAK